MYVGAIQIQTLLSSVLVERPRRPSLDGLRALSVNSQRVNGYIGTVYVSWLGLMPLL